MTRRSRWLRWTSTFLAYPLGALLAVTLVGAGTTVPAAALGGLLAGVVLGGAQWLALRPAGVPMLWWPATAGGLALGNAAVVAATSGATTPGALVTRGLVSGLLVGLAQALTVRAGLRGTLVWVATTAGAWAVGWAITSRVIVDAEKGFATFGSSGALVATLLTGLALGALVRDRASTSTPSTATTATTVTAVAA